MSIEEHNKRFPDWKKVFVAILEKQIETVLGENAIDEIKQPHLQKELTEKLGGIYDTVEKQFLEQIHNDEIREAVSNLPLSSLPSLQQAFGEFFRQPQSDKLNAALKSQLKMDYPRLPEDQIDTAVHLYTKILHDELVPLSEQFQRMSMAYSLEKISNHTNQLDTIASLLRDLVGHVKTVDNSRGNRTTPAIRIRPELTEYEDYPWLPFMSYRYLESLDSARFNDLSRNSEIKMLNGKSELLEALLFGDGIALSEPQLIDSRGAVDALGELIDAANDVKVRIPIRLASRNPGQSVFDLASSNIGNIDESQLSRRYVISANPALDLDVSRRKLWSQQLSQGMRGIEAVLKGSSTSESEFVTSLFTTLNYIDHEGGFVIPARNEPDRFYREIEQVLGLTTGDLEDMCQQKRDADIPEIMHPQWFANRNEAEAAAKLIVGLQAIINKLGSIPKGRSPIYTELAALEKENSLLAEGIKEIVDSIYNHVVGLAGNADSLSDTMGGDAKNILVRAGHAISQWARQTEKKEDGDYRYEIPWAWGGASQLTWSSQLDTSQVKKLVKVVPWQAILEATKEPNWKESLASYRLAANMLQVVDRGSISLGVMGEKWRQKHLDAHQALNDAWKKHIEISARLISNQCWKLTLDGMQYYSPENENRPLQANQSYRTMGTMADFSVEMQQFRINAVHRNEFENNIYGMINEIAQKRQH